MGGSVIRRPVPGRPPAKTAPFSIGWERAFTSLPVGQSALRRVRVCHRRHVGFNFGCLLFGLALALLRGVFMCCCVCNSLARCVAAVGRCLLRLISSNVDFHLITLAFNWCVFRSLASWLRCQCGGLMRRSISVVISLGRVACISLPTIIRRHGAVIRHRRLVNCCSANGAWVRLCLSYKEHGRHAHGRRKFTGEALHVLTVEQPARAHVRLSANTNRVAYAFPASDRDRTPLATQRPLARLSWARGLHQGRHGGAAEQVRVTP